MLWKVVTLTDIMFKQGMSLQAKAVATTRHLVRSSGGSPSSEFMEDGGIGSWEAVLCWSNLDFSDLTPNQEIDTWTVGLNWYLNKNIRVMFNYSKPELDDDNVDVIATRFQLAF